MLTTETLNLYSAMTGKSHNRQIFTCVLLTFLATGFAFNIATACDTPVYRYAMYNWKTAPYRVFFFHDPVEKSSDTQSVNNLISELSVSQQAVNLELVTIDSTDMKSIERLPEVVQTSWKRGREKSDAKKSGGFYVIFSPWGRELFAGRLDIDTLRAMTESPARKRLGELLAEGKLVAVCLNSKNKDENSVLDKALKDLAEQIESDSELPRIDVDRLDVSPDDPLEKWFVHNLMLTEPDLKDYAGKPMLFMSYGRGRLMLPYIGKGITAENLVRCVMFLTGACSCEVKADNPGVDLLMRCDWEAAADEMAANDDDASTGDGQLAYQEFDPSKLSNSKTAENRKPEIEDGTEHATEEQQSDNDQTLMPAELETQSHESFAARQTWILGGGLAFVFAFVVIGGLFFMRRSGM